MPDIKLTIEQAYSAFNKRDIDGALALTTKDVSKSASQNYRPTDEKRVYGY